MRAAIVVSLLVTACAGLDSDPVPPDDPVESHVTAWDIKLPSPTPLDVVFVIDDSPELAPYAQKIVSSYGAMMKAFDAMPYGRPDVHIAVLTADGASFRRSDAIDGPFLVDEVHEDYQHVANYRGSLRDAVASIASVTAASSAPPRLLDVLDRALHDPGNGVFARREGAILDVVIITARDDASPATTAEYAEWVRCVPTVVDDVAIAVARVGATPRLDAFAGEFPVTSVLLSLSDDNPVDLMQLLPQLQRRPFNDFCIQAPADLDLAAPGIQTECTAEVTHFGSLAGTSLPSCDTSDGACWYWRLVEGCTLGMHVNVDFKGAAWPRNSHLLGQCVSRN
jgi:hypothetical protein